jgi:hypothetical protein
MGEKRVIRLLRGPAPALAQRRHGKRAREGKPILTTDLVETETRGLKDDDVFKQRSVVQPRHPGFRFGGNSYLTNS